MTKSIHCRICDGVVSQFYDFGQQPLSDAFLRKEDVQDEYFYRLMIGMCESCTMVQLLEEVDRDKMFHQAYPYMSGGSALMRAHFADTAKTFLETELHGPDAFIVELGSNDGSMLSHIADAGCRHLGVEPSGDVGAVAAAKGVRVLNAFFEQKSAQQIRAQHGPASVIYAANTMCHIPYMDSVFAGVNELLSSDGVMVFEDPYFGDIIDQTSFDQVYDEHFYLFTARSVRELAHRHGLELVDVARLEVHGGEVRYTLARSGARPVSAAVAEMLAMESTAGLAEHTVLDRFAENVSAIRSELRSTLDTLRSEGLSVAGYGATAKSATALNMCGIGPDLVHSIYDNTPAKQNLITPGSHIPVRPASEFAHPYPDVALLLAWNHADEIIARERGFTESGGRWLVYVPDVRFLAPPAHV